MNSKEKGNRGERELLALLLARGLIAWRNQQGITGDAQRPRGGLENPDIDVLVHGIPIHVECKREERLSIYKAIAQAVRDANGKKLPVVAHRTNRHDWLVTVRLTDLLNLIGASEG